MGKITWLKGVKDTAPNGHHLSRNQFTLFQLFIIVGLFFICLHVFVTSFKRQNNVTTSNAMTYVILQGQLTSASACFPHAFKVVTLLLHITQFFSIGYIGEVCSNKVFTCSILLYTTDSSVYLIDLFFLTLYMLCIFFLAFIVIC